MCFNLHNTDMIDWLRMQVRVLEAWRESVAARPEIDLELVTRLERHYQWLTAEVGNLENLQSRRPHDGPQLRMVGA